MTKLSKEQMVRLAFKGSECNWQKDCMEKFIALEFGFFENGSKFFDKSQNFENTKITQNSIIVTRKTLHNWRKRVRILWDATDSKGFEDVSWEDLDAMRKYGIRDDFVTKMYEIWNQTLIEWSKCGVSPGEIQKPSYSLLFWVQFLLMYHPEFCIFDILVIAEAYVQRMRLYEAFKEENTYEPRYMREDIDNWLAYRPYESAEKLKAYEFAITTKKVRPLRTPWLDQVFCRDANIDRFSLPSQIIEKFLPYELNYDFRIIGITGRFLVEEKDDSYLVVFENQESTISKSRIQKYNSKEFSPEIQNELNEIRRKYRENDY